MLEGGGGWQWVKEGVLEKRSEGWLQHWKKKRCVLTEEGLLLSALRQPPPPPDEAGQAPAAAAAAAAAGCPWAGAKQLPFSMVKTVDCVERKGKYVYFTVVTSQGREIDFRGAQEQGWNAAITLQLVRYKNRQAVLAVQSTRRKEQQQQQQQQPQPQQQRLRCASDPA